VKFSYRDPATKLDLPKSTDINQHFKEIRDSESLKMFNDATFDETMQQQQ
jgi:hypothetical protein